MILMQSNTNISQEQPFPEWKYYPEDFAYNDNIWDEDSEKIRKIKWIIDHKLSIGEKEIFLLYTHNNANYHELGRLLGCSSTTARNKIIQIREKIIANL